MDEETQKRVEKMKEYAKIPLCHSPFFYLEFPENLFKKEIKKDKEDEAD